MFKAHWTVVDSFVCSKGVHLVTSAGHHRYGQAPDRRRAKLLEGDVGEIHAPFLLRHGRSM